MKERDYDHGGKQHLGQNYRVKDLRKRFSGKRSLPLDRFVPAILVFLSALSHRCQLVAWSSKELEVIWRQDYGRRYNPKNQQMRIASIRAYTCSGCFLIDRLAR